MGNLTGSFTADGSSETLTAGKFTICLGTDTNQDFGSGGLVALKVRQDEKLDWTTNSLFSESGVFSSVEYVSGVQFKLELAGSTNPNIDYSIKYE